MPKLKNSICNEEIYESFFHTHARMLRNYIYYKFGDEDQAEDVVQETFVKLWNNCGKVPLEKAKSYIYTVATNLSASIKRHDKVKLKYEAHFISEQKDRTNESPEFLTLEKEFMEKLNKAISTLPERQREAFLLNRIEKKTYNEIAEIMEVSVKAIEKLIHKALLKLRNEIGNI